MELKEKLTKYEKGEYSFSVPPVCTANWDTKAWVKWIDACNGWYPKEKTTLDARS